MSNKQDGLVLYLEHRSALIGYATELVGCRARAEDIVQEAFLRFDARASKGSEDAVTAKTGSAVTYPVSYLYRIVHNLAIDWRRRPEASAETTGAEVLSSLPASTATPEQTLLGQDRLRTLAEALAELPERTRIAFDMHRLQGRSLQEIADHLGVSVVRAHQLVKDAIRHGAKRLDED